MTFVSFKQMLIIALLITSPILGKRPKKEKPPKQPRPALSQEQKQAIVSNVAQVMGGVCTIAQDPHNPHNIGNSVASMIHGLINIIVEKFAHRNININDAQAMEKYLNELCHDISAEITEIIITKKLLR
ncbi:MAG TPA: hypothetical protein VKR54_01185 [Candidatus Babeliales bacterium]|jgi:hypothetical protein|nr:hypothetical protein [Candidatus Babeliales bacterium]